MSVTEKNLPPVSPPTLEDIETQVARLRATSTAKQAQYNKATHDRFDRQIETMFTEAAESKLGAIALTLSVSSEFNIPADEN